MAVAIHQLSISFFHTFFLSLIAQHKPPLNSVGHSSPCSQPTSKLQPSSWPQDHRKHTKVMLINFCHDVGSHTHHRSVSVEVCFTLHITVTLLRAFMLSMPRMNVYPRSLMTVTHTHVSSGPSTKLKTQKTHILALPLLPAHSNHAGTILCSHLAETSAVLLEHPLSTNT